MTTFNGNQLKDGLTIDTWVDWRSGETHYRVCDAVGIIYSTIYESRLKRFFKEGQ